MIIARRSQENHRFTSIAGNLMVNILNSKRLSVAARVSLRARWGSLKHMLGTTGALLSAAGREREPGVEGERKHRCLQDLAAG